MTIQALIDKQDTFEIIRDKVASILVTEVASQMALATAGGKDPDDWKVRIYLERANAWEQFLDPDVVDKSPLCNIWIDGSDYDPSDSNIINNQKSETTLNLDLYGYGESRSDGAGHTPGDQESAFSAQRAYRLVRNILFNEIYTYLDLPRKTVYSRWPISFRQLQPEFNGQPVENIVCIRFRVRVDHRELTDAQLYETIEAVSVTMKRAEDGSVISEIVFDYTV